jgi:5-formyltetrahydrofolate cyclo-ligase
VEGAKDPASDSTMNTEIFINKKALRRKMRDLVEHLDAAAKGVRSEQACRLLSGQALWKNARSVLFYAPMEEEVNVWPLLDAAITGGKRVALPRYRPETDSYGACEVRNTSLDIWSGAFGIREPAPHCPLFGTMQLDLILVPGLAFDQRGGRLGHGKGYYDRLLAIARGVTCGVAFDEQIVEVVPVTPHDVTVDCILTPTRWITV